MTNTAGFMISPAAPYKNLNSSLLHQSNKLDRCINKYTLELYMFSNWRKKQKHIAIDKYKAQ